MTVAGYFTGYFTNYFNVAQAATSSGGGGPGNDPYYHWWLLRRRRQFTQRFIARHRRRLTQADIERIYSPEHDAELKRARRELLVKQAALYGIPKHDFFNAEPLPQKPVRRVRKQKRLRRRVATR